MISLHKIRINEYF